MRVAASASHAFGARPCAQVGRGHCSKGCNAAVAQSFHCAPSASCLDALFFRYSRAKLLCKKDSTPSIGLPHLISPRRSSAYVFVTSESPKQDA